MRQAVSTPSAPAAIGPYSQAIRAGNLLFVSGQIPTDPTTGTLVDGGVQPQTHQVFKNIGEILKAAGASFDHVVLASVFLADMNDFARMNEVYATYFAAMNEVYAGYFNAPAPARATVQVSRLPKDARIEIDAIAVVE